MKNKYTVVGGNPFRMGSDGLRILAHANSIKEVREVINNNYYECYGLMMVLNNITGKQIPIEWS